MPVTQENQPRPLVAGNWKMNGLTAGLGEAGRLCELVAADGPLPCDVMICPPATLLATARRLFADSPVMLGGQDCHAAPGGAHTGDIAGPMLADVGCVAVIVGHSERRADHGEDDSLVNAKARAAHAAGLCAIICIGESEAQRDAGATLDVLAGQLAGSLPEGAGADNTIVAYEPVWAIGSGRTPSLDEVAQAHGFIRARLVDRFGDGAAGLRLLYGGSVKPSNAATLMAVRDVNGALVGGASLKADDFWGIIKTYQPAG